MNEEKIKELYKQWKDEKIAYDNLKKQNCTDEFIQEQIKIRKKTSYEKYKSIILQFEKQRLKNE